MILNDNDSALVRLRAIEALQGIEHEWTRPHILLRCRFTYSEPWWTCAPSDDESRPGALRGKGLTPKGAADDFDKRWETGTPERATP